MIMGTSMSMGIDMGTSMSMGIDMGTSMSMGMRTWWTPWCLPVQSCRGLSGQTPPRTEFEWSPRGWWLWLSWWWSLSKSNTHWPAMLSNKIHFWNKLGPDCLITPIRFVLLKSTNQTPVLLTTNEISIWSLQLWDNGLSDHHHQSRITVASIQQLWWRWWSCWFWLCWWI